jgi:hypothetical protein
MSDLIREYDALALRAQFMAVYAYTHQLGLTDAPWSREAERVYREWLYAGQPTGPSLPFVVGRANVDSLWATTDRSEGSNATES